MSDNQFHKQFNEGDNLPVSIPSADLAWSDMRGKLDAGMPEPAAAGRSWRGWWKWLVGVVAILFITWTVLTQLPAKKDNNHTGTDHAVNDPRAAGSQNENPLNKQQSDANAENVSRSNAAPSTNTGDSTAVANDRIASTASGDQQTETGTGNNGQQSVAANGNDTKTTAGALPLTHKTGEADHSPVNRESPNGSITEDTNEKGRSGKGNREAELSYTGSSAGKKNNNRKPPLINGNRNTSSTGNAIKKSSGQQDLNGMGPRQKPGNDPAIAAPPEKPAPDLPYSLVIADSSDRTISRWLPGQLPADPTDGSPLRARPPASPATARIKIQGGLQWNFQAPSGGNGSYFYNEKGKREPLRTFYPGAWLSFQQHKSMYTIEVSPFFTTGVPARPYSTETSGYTIGDTVFSTTETKTLQKLFGMSAAIGYSHNITGNWWAGGSLRSNWWRDGAATSTMDVLKRSDSGSFVDIKTTSSRTFLLTDTTWSSFSKVQFVLNADIFYRRNIWQAGLQLGLPVNSLTRRNGPRAPLYAALVLRLTIPPRNRKR